jgi:murein DD-endopeptidase MepM/ murein hydrolase activator NlpD
MKLLRLVPVFALLAGGLYVASNRKVLSHFEKQAPEFAQSSIPKGVGANAVPAAISIHDSGAGVQSLQISLEQGSRTLELHQQNFAPAVAEANWSGEITGLKGKLLEGPVQLVVRAHDGSMWANKIEKRFELNVDFSKPTLAVLTQQHIGNQGGAEFVLLESKDTNLQKVVVRVAEQEYPAVKAATLDTAFEGKEIYAVLFALPLEGGTSPKIEAIAEDSVGNITRTPISFRIKPYAQAPTTPKISAQFVAERVQPLYDEYIQEMTNAGSVLDISTDPVTIFRTVNEDLRKHLQERFSKLDKSRTGLARGVFSKPMPSATSSTFGEIRSYSLDGNPAGGSRHDGLDLASVKRDAVFAAHEGTVLLAEPFGIYGIAVIIDHGMQLTSLYGHLSSASVSAGDKVSSGQEIGRSGETGLAGGDHLHFEFRIGDTPVDPREWWDPHWIEDNIDGKIEAVKQSLTTQP